MTTNLNLLRGYRLTVHDQHWVLGNMRVLAARSGPPLALAAIDEALRVVLDGLRIEEAYTAARVDAADARDARDLDLRIQRILGAIHRSLAALAYLGREGTRGRAGSDALKLAFPEGLAGHTHRRFTEKAVLTEQLIARLRSAELADVVGPTHIPGLLDDLEPLQRRFVELLSVAPEVGFLDVLAARQRCTEATQRAVCAVVASLPLGDTARLDALLLPWSEAMRRVGVAARAAKARGDANEVAQAPVGSLPNPAHEPAWLEVREAEGEEAEGTLASAAK